MKIKTQLMVSIITFSIILVIIGYSVAITQIQISELNNQSIATNNIQTGATDLNFISNNYFLSQDSSYITLWQAKYSTLTDELTNLNSTNPRQQALVNAVGNDIENLNSVFSGVTSFLSATPRNVSVRVLPSFQTQWNRMAVGVQALAFDSQKLSENIQDQTNQAILANTILTVAILSVFGAFLITIYFVAYQRTSRSITKLKDGIGVIGSGNLDYIVNAGKNDEVSEVAKSVNYMAKNLKIVTASKAELEEEIVERKKAEEAVKLRTETLEQTQKKLEENACLLEEYSSQMEELAEQRLEKLKDSERLAAVGATAGMVGHDIRNPLQAITGDLYLAKQEASDLPESEQKSAIIESIEETEKNVEYINKIVQDLQDYARPLNPKAEESDLKEIVDKLIINNGVPNNVKVIVKVDNEETKIRADAYYLNRILYNLVTNAIQAMPEGGKLTITAKREGSDTVLAVADTGVGIPKEVQAKMFAVMFTTKSKGQGFGLPVVKRMTESLGGTVSFESQEGKGTTFTVRLPLVRN
jgi:signal transduction histidine kinase